MNSDFLQKRIRAFGFAFNGLVELWKKEKNTRIHLFFTILAIAAGFLLKISAAEFSIIVLVIGAVWSAEAFNSAVERTVDLVTMEKKPLAKAAKDLSAGAVLIFAFSSIIIGLIIYLPKIVSLIIHIFE